MEAGKTAERQDGRPDRRLRRPACQSQNGKITAAELDEIEKAGCPTCGCCSGMFTANSMNCLAEALGMALPGNGTLLATRPTARPSTSRAAARIVAMAKRVRPGRARATACCPARSPRLAAFDNAMILDMAMGGSTNTVLHILAIAHEAGVPFSMKRINELSQQARRTSARSRPSSKYHVEDVARAGGIHTILGEVARGRPGLLDLSCPTVTGKTLGENIAAYDIRAATATAEARAASRGSVPAASAPARPGPCPSVAAEAALAGCRCWPFSMPEGEGCQSMPAAGNGLGRRSGRHRTGFDPFDVIRTGRQRLLARGRPVDALRQPRPRRRGRQDGRASSPKMLRSRGPAVIFESEEEAYNGIVFGKVKAGDVVVIRYEGPARRPRHAGDARPDDRHQGRRPGRPVRPDHRRPLLGRHGRAPRSATSAPRRPSAARSRLIRDGDIVEIDIPAGALNVRLSAEELVARRASWTPPAPRYTRGWLARYAAMATSADTGAILRWDHETR